MSWHIVISNHESTKQSRNDLPRRPTTALTLSKIEDEHFAGCNELPFHSIPGLEEAEGGKEARGVGKRQAGRKRH